MINRLLPWARKFTYVLLLYFIEVVGHSSTTEDCIYVTGLKLPKGSFVLGAYTRWKMQNRFSGVGLNYLLTTFSASSHLEMVNKIKKSTFTSAETLSWISYPVTAKNKSNFWKLNCLLSYSYLHRLGKAPWNHPFQYAFFFFFFLNHTVSTSCLPSHVNLRAGCQIQTVSPKHSSAFASTLYQHCHGYIIIPT